MNMPARKRLTRRVGTVLILLLLTALLLGAAGTSAMPNRLPAAPVNAAVTTPRDFFGYDIGQDYKLTPWQTHVLQGEGVRKGIVEYANELQRTSPRVRVFQYGTTEEGRPMVMTVITSPQNWAQINDLKGILKKLADPRQVASDAEAKFLAQRGKAVYWISPAIHATERTSPEVGVRLSYRLASDEDAWTRNLLDNVIVVIEGTLNPDGLEMVTDWYYKYKDTAYANSSPPYYNKYINHDNNRDFLGMGIAETRANTAARFEWNPTLYHDLHQTQNMLFMYPAMDPTNLAVNAITVAEWLGYGGHTLTGLIAKGWTGVFLYDYTDNWYPGYNDIFSFMHNTMGTLYELRGANMATPIIMTATPRGRSWYNPAPYTPGFTWRLIDAVNLEEDAIRLKLGYLAQNKDDLLYNFYLKGKLNYQKSAGEPPYAFMIPANGGDNVDVTDLINNLHLLHRIEVDRLAAATTIAGQQYQAGDYVVRADQPYGLTAKNYLATPPYPGGQTPFDVVSWDYGLLRDVQVVPVTTALPAGLSLIPVTLKIPYAGSLTGDVSGTYVIEHQSNNNLAVALPQLWADPNMGVAQADAAFTSGGRTFPAGTFVVTTTGSPADHAKIKGLAEGLGLTAYAVTDSVAATPLHQPKVGLYTPNNSTGNTMPEGWVRLRLDATGFPYTRLYKEDVISNTIAGLDVVIIPDMTTSTLINGSTSASLPPEYRGGIGTAGEANLKSFVQNGGQLVLMGRATRVPIERNWGIGVSLAGGLQASAARLPASVDGEPVRAASAQTEEIEEPDRGVARPDMASIAAAALYSPGSTVRILVDRTAKVGYGYDAEEASWLDDASTPFFTPTSGDVSVIATYPATGQLLLNGYVVNDEVIRGKAAIVDAPMGSGHIVLLGPNTLYRAQATRTFMFFWNAVFEGGR